MRKTTPWYEVYRQLAELLSIYYSVHRENSGTHLYRRCISEPEFKKYHAWINKFARVFEIRSIDPIHIFSSLNERNLDFKLRVKRINIFFKLISQNKHQFEEIDFTGCPSPFSIKILSARKENVQAEIWNTFNEIVIKGQRALNQDVFDSIPAWYGIDISSFTIFLFWIDSSNFLPLDKNTNTFFLRNGLYNNRPRIYIEYKRIIKNSNSNIYRDIAKIAYNHKKDSKEEKKVLMEIKKALSTKIGREEGSMDFKLVAVRPLTSMNFKFSKVLTPNMVYPLFHSYDFSDLDNIKYDKLKDLKLYDIVDQGNTLNINVSAIVGKNGSGKSSIVELIYLAINNLTKKILKNKCQLISEPEVHVELFYTTDSLYKLRIRNKIVELFKYENKKTTFVRCKKVAIDKYFLKSFFYSIAINYSHYALNSKDIGDWLELMFHKNDAYQAPLVINPMRTDGNIDINKEKSLVKSRLLANILEPEPELRILTENNRRAETLKYSLNKEKVSLLYENTKFPSIKYQTEILNIVYEYYNIPKLRSNEIVKCANKYIFKKLVSISRNYPHYHVFYNERMKKFKKSLFNKYLKDLIEDKSHITNKLNQAINFLKYSHLKYHDISKPIKVGNLAEAIEKVISDNHPDRQLRTIELIPPAFFKIEIYLSDGSEFEHLSSGEKQRIHTINSLVYHLLNINSVSDRTALCKYNYVNILFDEVELYFHPEMQRTFIDFLLKYLQKVPFNDILGLNFCFITHSPFILSDIPANNILFLEVEADSNKSTQVHRDDRTFGGNIHDLLKDSFFLQKGYMGDFAKRKITSVIDYLNKVIEINIEGKKETLSQEWDSEKVKIFIDTIGEMLLRNSLKDLYSQAFFRTGIEDIDKEIHRLQTEKNRLLQ